MTAFGSDAGDVRIATFASLLVDCSVRSALDAVHRVESADPLTKLAAVICASTPARARRRHCPRLRP
jgi:hypothetical protein